MKGGVDTPIFFTPDPGDAQDGTMKSWWTRSEGRVILAAALLAAVAGGAVMWTRRERGRSSEGAVPARLDLNRATAAELESLPGITTRLATRIVAHRNRHGPFTRVEALVDVPGVTAQQIENWTPFLKAEPHDEE